MDTNAFNHVEGGIQATQTRVDDLLRETKKHGTEGFPLAVYLDDFTDFENGYICWHWHEEVQFTLILQGEFICQVEKETVHLKAGEAIFMNAGLLHQIRPCVLSQGKLYSFIFKPSILGGTETTDIYQNSVAPLIRRNLPYIKFAGNETIEEISIKQAKYTQDEEESDEEKTDEKETDEIEPDGEESDEKEIVDNLHKIAQIYIEKKHHYQMKICCLLHQIWIKILESLPEEEEQISAEKKRDDTRIKLALQYMQAHFEQNLALDEIAREAMTSRSELCRCFQRTLHMTPKEFLLQYRIRQATVMLQNPETRILDVAENTGFNSPSHFGVYFHKYMGCTPREYRNRGKLVE